MSAEDDIDRFIEEQKKKIARERKDLQQTNAPQSPRSLNNGPHQNGDTSLKESYPPRGRPGDKGDDRQQSQTDDTGIPLGNYTAIRDKLQAERQEEYKKFIEQKNNRSSSKRTIPQGDGMSLPIGERLSAQEQSRAQRNKEYNEFLKQKEGQRRRSGEPSSEKPAGVLPGQPPAGPINGYGQPPTNGYGPPPTNGYSQQPTNGYGQPPVANDGGGPYGGPRPQREAASQTPIPPRDYDDGGPRGPRKGWGTPQPVDYEELVRRKREEESRYRRYDDLDFYQPRTLRPAHSDPYLNRYEDDGRRSSRREYYDDYDRRRVRFSDEPPPGPPIRREGSYSDRAYRPRQRESLEEPALYDWSRSRGGRSRTFTDGERPKPALRQDEPDRPPRAKSATLADESGLPLGQRDTQSATRRKKAQYRKELEEQMELTKQAKKREKALDRSPGFPAAAARPPAPQNVSGRQSRNQPEPQGGVGPSAQQPPSQGGGYTPSFLNQPYGTRQQQPPAASNTPFPGQYGGADLQSQGQPYGAGSGRPPLPNQQPLGDLGLKDAFAKSQPNHLDKPFSLNYPPVSSLTQPSTNTDPYMYYGMRNPLEPDPHPSMITGLHHPAAAPGNNLQSPLMERYLLLQQQQQQLLQQLDQTPYQQQLPNSTLAGPAQFNQAINNPNVSKQDAAQLRGESSIKNFIGDADLSPRSKLGGAAYRQQLLLQMQEKEAKKQADIAAKAQYEAKMEKELGVYDPWGKGGGGAPMRDKQGKIVADLKQLHNRNETLLNDPNRKDLQLYAATGNAPPINPAAGGIAPGQDVSPLLAAAAAAGVGAGPGPGGVAAGPSYGIVKGTITGAAPNPTADASRNEYQEMLRLQVEDKKRREAEEKEKIRLEEEKEERRLEAQRERIKKEYEDELNRKKQKEEAKQKQNEELERQLEAKRKEADEKKKQLNEKRRKEAEEQRKRDQNVNPLNRVASPPIPTLRTKEPELQRIASPPIPTLQKKDKAGTSSRPAEPPRRYLVDWLREIDPDLVVYAALLAENGYKTWNTIRRLKRSTLLELCPEMKHGHMEAILHEVTRAQTPSQRKDEDFPSVSDRSSPPLPAVSTRERGGPKDEKNVMGALSAMRVQLAYEQQRIQSQLDKHRDYDPYNPLPKAAHAPRRGSPQVDVFELARHKGSVAVLRNQTHQAAEDFEGLKNRTFGHGKKPSTSNIPSMSNIGRGSPAIPLDSDSAFIGIDTGETHMPKTPTRQTRTDAAPSPINNEPRKAGRSVSRLDDDDLDQIIAKSKARSDAIDTLHEHDSDADDILDKFLSKKSYDSRPPSGKSEDLSLWLRPGQT